MFIFYSLGSCEMLHNILAVDFITTNLGFNLSGSKGRFPETLSNVTVNTEQIHFMRECTGENGAILSTS